MKQSKTNPEKLPGGSMINQKTNEDFNKKMPNPKDPNEQKDRPETVLPEIEAEQIRPMQGETPKEDSNQQNLPRSTGGIW